MIDRFPQVRFDSESNAESNSRRQRLNLAAAAWSDMSFVSRR
jgi:hypothetical protein